MKSMTGYGAAEGKVGRGKLFIEIRAVNHRYCDIAFRIPPKMHSLDHKLRAVVSQHVARGKVEVYVKERQDVAPQPRVNLNRSLARAYEHCLRTYEAGLPARQRNTARSLLDVIDFRDLLQVEESQVKYENYWRSISVVCGRALKQLDQMRRREGAFLKRDQLAHLKRLRQITRKIRQRLTVNRTKMRKKILAERRGQSDENGRTPHEIVGSLLERMDVTEELTRLESHAAQYQRFLSDAGAIGRQLDFLLQEMNREVNTLSAKAADAEISQRVVELKSGLEKMREQAQNIE
jgi:uncharacterized protein (TIGR00255 family)